MKESYLWQTIREKLPLPQWSRIENAAGNGVPDVNGFLNGYEVWLELKMQKGNQLEFQASQAGWITRRLAMNARNVFVLVRRNHASGDALILYKPTVIERIRRSADRSIFVEPESSDILLRLPKPFDWPILQAYLFGTNTSRAGW